MMDTDTANIEAQSELDVARAKAELAREEAQLAEQFAAQAENPTPSDAASARDQPLLQAQVDDLQEALAQLDENKVEARRSKIRAELAALTPKLETATIGARRYYAEQMAERERAAEKKHQDHLARIAAQYPAPAAQPAQPDTAGPAAPDAAELAAARRALYADLGRPVPPM